MKSLFITLGFIFLAMCTGAQNKLTAISTSKGTAVVHTVTSGESLIYVGAKYGVPLSTLAKANGMKTDQELKIGQTVKVPLTATNLNTESKKGIPVYYQAGAKETLATISKKFNKIDVKTLQTWNKMKKKEEVSKGQPILVGYIVDNYAGKKEAEKKKEEKNAVAKKEIKKAGSTKAIVIGTSVNIRKGPTTDEPIVGSAQQDETITVTKQVNNEWVAVRTNDGIEGYAASQYLELAASKKDVAVKMEVKKAIVGTGINIRMGPGTDQPIVGKAENDEIITVTNQINDEWAAVRTDEGVVGYIASRFLGPVNNNERAAKADSKIQQTAAEEKALAKNTETKKLNNDQAEPQVSSAPIAESTPVDGSGFFKTAYNQQNNGAPAKEVSLHSGIFKTNKGWDDGKYYLLIDDVTAGTIVKLYNPGNNAFVYAKVLGDVKSLRQKNGPPVRISDAAAMALKINNNDFDVVVMH